MPGIEHGCSGDRCPSRKYRVVREDRAGTKKDRRGHGSDGDWLVLDISDVEYPTVAGRSLPVLVDPNQDRTCAFALCLGWVDHTAELQSLLARLRTRSDGTHDSRQAARRKGRSTEARVDGTAHGRATVRDLGESRHGSRAYRTR